MPSMYIVSGNCTAQFCYGAYILALIRSYRNLLLIDAKCSSTEFFARRLFRVVFNALSIRVLPLSLLCLVSLTAVLDRLIFFFK